MTPMIVSLARQSLRLAACGSLLSLAACSVLSRPEPATVYRLPLAAAASTPAPARAWSLQVGTPLAGAAINRNAITVLPQPDQVNNYRGARWSDPAPILFRDALVSQLQQSHPGTLITSDDAEVPTRFKLVGRLDAFQSEYHQGRPHIVIHYQSQLLSGDADHVIATHSFQVEVTPASAKVADVVAGFGLAVQQLDGQLQPWLDGALDAQPAEAAATTGPH